MALYPSSGLQTGSADDVVFIGICFCRMVEDVYGECGYSGEKKSETADADAAEALLEVYAGDVYKFGKIKYNTCDLIIAAGRL